MNKSRRNEISQVVADVADALANLEAAIDRIASIRDDEQEYFDVMPESLQSGERGTTAEYAIEQLDEVVEALQALIDADITQALSEATA